MMNFVNAYHKSNNNNITKKNFFFSYSNFFSKTVNYF